MFNIKEKNIPSEDSLLIKALKWAYDKGSEGFYMSDLMAAVSKNINDEMWIRRMLMGEINGEPHLIFHIGAVHTGGEYKYFITSSGAALLIDYMDLKDAREGSREAKKLAIISLILATVVGLVQIYYAAKDAPTPTTNSTQIILQS